VAVHAVEVFAVAMVIRNLPFVASHVVVMGFGGVRVDNTAYTFPVSVNIADGFEVFGPKTAGVV
jgi:hypothetical protein